MKMFVVNVNHYVLDQRETSTERWKCMKFHANHYVLDQRETFTEDENVSADIEKWLVFTGSHEVSFKVSFKVRSHPITPIMFFTSEVRSEGLQMCAVNDCVNDCSECKTNSNRL